MKLARSHRQRLIVVASLIAPVVCVQLARWVFDAPSTPSGASAASPTAVPEQQAAPVAKPTKEQMAVAMWVQGQRQAKAPASPMDHGEPKPVVEAKPEPRPEPAPAKPEPDPALELAAKLNVGSIFGRMATINGRVRTVGDEVAPGWKLSQVDPRAGAIRLVNAEGKAVDLRIQARGQR